MNSLIASVGWTEDSRDDILFPKKGGLRRVNAEVSTPGLDIQMYKLTFQESVIQGNYKRSYPNGEWSSRVCK